MWECYVTILLGVICLNDGAIVPKDPYPDVWRELLIAAIRVGCLCLWMWRQYIDIGNGINSSTLLKENTQQHIGLIHMLTSLTYTYVVHIYVGFIEMLFTFCFIGCFYDCNKNRNQNILV